MAKANHHKHLALWGGGGVEPSNSKGFEDITTPCNSKHAARQKNLKRCAFTMAEVLIAIGVIGIVAVFTIPMIMQNLNRTKFAPKFKKTISTLSQAAILSQARYYSDYSSLYTESSSDSCAEESLAKNNLTMCGLLNSVLSGQTFVGMYGTVKGAGGVYKITKEALPNSALSTENTMIFSLSDGSFVGFNKKATKCGVTPGTPMNGDTLGTVLGNCIGFIDVNGTRPPNHEIKCKDSNANNSGAICPLEKTVGDVFPVVFHNATVELVSANTLEQAVIARRRDFSKWEVKTVSKGLSRAQCEALPESYGLKKCRAEGSDMYAAAVKACGGVQNLPSAEELHAFAKTLYPSCNDNLYSEGVGRCWGTATLNVSNLDSSFAGLGSSWTSLWSGTLDSAGNPYAWAYNGDKSNSTFRYYAYRHDASTKFICLGD